MAAGSPLSPSLDTGKQKEVDYPWSVWSWLGRSLEFVLLPDVFVCLTQAQLLWAKRQISRSKLVAIPNGVDLTFFHPLENQSNYPFLTSYSRRCCSARLKRVDTTIKAISTLPNISLLLIGAGPLEAKLKLGVKLL